ncbi:sugar isomerase domain-containing protein [Actinoalloteichus hymeniacidonis]|uniref:SIS domain-containing protein n=1 Tax=Actinoalloteichus hymeniacidonis TaxID=340345 RepID=A0AAC9MYP1_9PSEU|nr:sugar isomerase domain-containing protein [Actinoalloteichus hymeniacidonis]AOS63197.1 hypothetical protein TL08_11915 [Actinoalloteichus hymeniacidonis]MBB5908766.1 putative phosphosugar-binding protein [Actinoalloteichus hymeniacidonis]
MTDSIPTSYGTIVGDHLARIEKHNAEAIDRAASAILTTVRADGTVYTAGAGHSLAAVAETFYRAGGLALIRPLYHPDLLPMHGARSSTTAERRSGLAEEVLGKVDITGEDTLVVFSHSGINPYPVELAAAGRAAGCPVIAVTSTAAGAAAPRRSHSTVAEQADVILDTLVPPGDAAYPRESPVTAALSSISTGFLWNLVLVRLHDRTETELPRWRSANVVGGDQANAALFDRQLPRIPELG